MSEGARRINNSLCCHDRGRAVTERPDHLKGFGIGLSESPRARTCSNKPANWPKVSVMKMMVAMTKAVTAAAAAGRSGFFPPAMIKKMMNSHPKHRDARPAARRCLCIYSPK